MRFDRLRACDAHKFSGFSPKPGLPVITPSRSRIRSSKLACANISLTKALAKGATAGSSASGKYSIFGSSIFFVSEVSLPSLAPFGRSDIPAVSASRAVLRHRSRDASSRHLAFGNGCQPTSESAHEGCCNVAPRRPDAEHRACWRSMSDDAAAPHRITNGTSATANAVTATTAEPKPVRLTQQFTERRNCWCRRPRPCGRGIIMRITWVAHGPRAKNRQGTKSRASRAGRYTGGYPIPADGRHLSHQMPWRPGGGFTPLQRPRDRRPRRNGMGLGRRPVSLASVAPRCADGSPIFACIPRASAARSNPAEPTRHGWRSAELLHFNTFYGVSRCLS